MGIPAPLPPANSITIPFDSTGLLASNLFAAEVHPIDEFTYLIYNLIIPNAPPFFGVGLVVTYTNSLNVSSVMVLGIDYSMAFLYDAATESIGTPIYGGIVILNTALTGTITLKYQSIGGLFLIDRPTIVNQLLSMTVDPINTYFDVFSTATVPFPIVLNNYLLPDTIGQDALLAELILLANTIANKTPVPVSLNGLTGNGVIIPIMPNPPTSPIAVAGDTQVALSFTAPIVNGGSIITGYTVTSSPAGGIDINASSTSLTHTIIGLTNGVAYTFTVIATNLAGSSLPSTASAAVTPTHLNTAPSIPLNTTVVAGNAQATVSFTVPTSNGGTAITGYTVTSLPAGGVDTNAGTTGLSHVIIGLTNGTAYTFTVTATNSVGTSAPSAASFSVTPIAPPTVSTPPLSPVAVAGDTQATISFTAPTSNGGAIITGYTVISLPAGGIDANAGTIGLSHVITGLTNGVSYTFTVTATNSVGTSTPSTASSAITPIHLNTVPSMPLNVMATAGNTRATISFATPTSNGGAAITGYIVTSLPAGGVDTNAGTTGLSHIVTGLTNGTSYTFTVTATNSVGTSAPSAASSSVTPIYVAPGIAIFMGGVNIGSYYSTNVNGAMVYGSGYISLNYVGVYTFATNVMVSGTVLLSTVSYGACVGDSIHAVYCGGSHIAPPAASVILNTTSNYTYSTNTIVAGSNLSTTSWFNAGASNSVTGIVGGGLNTTATGSGTGITNLITYTSGTFVVGSTLATAPWSGCATGTLTDAMFIGGQNGQSNSLLNSIVDYNYASNTNALMTANTFYSDAYRCAGGNSTMAVIGGSVSSGANVTELFNYAAKTVVSGSGLTYNSSKMAGASSSTTAIFAGGYISSFLNTVSLYSYANNVATAAATLGIQAEGIASTAPNSGVNY